MKKFLSTFFLLMLSTIVLAQDVIVKKDGSTILAKVVKVSSTEVEYKKHSNQNGPTYTISVRDLISINYENGDSDKFGDSKVSDKNEVVEGEENSTSYAPVVINPVKNSMVSESTIQYEIDERVRKGKNMKAWGTVLYCCGFGAIIATSLLCGIDNPWMATLTGFAVGAPLYVPGIILGSVGNKMVQNAEATIRKKYQAYDSSYFKNLNNVDKILRTKDHSRVSLSYAVRF